MSNNLRIIYNNLVDLSTTSIIPSSAQLSTPATNLKSDTKSLTWRSAATATSGTTVKAILLVDLGTNKTLGGVVLAFTNLNSNTASITVKGYTTVPSLGGTNDNPTVASGTPVFTKTDTCCPWNILNLPNWGINPVLSSNYSYGGGTYARVWFPEHKDTAVRFLTIEITDNYLTTGVGRYIEVSRLILGDYWSPQYNTGYGMTATIKDLSTHERTESGDLITRRGPRYRCLTFSLDWLDYSDRIQMTRLLLGNGSSKPILVSLFPDSVDTVAGHEQEQSHQIYGKLQDLPGVTYQHYEIYSVAMDIEEI